MSLIGSCGCDDGCSSCGCDAVVFRKEITSTIECGICYDFSGISSPSSTNMLYICDNIPGTPAVLLGTGTEVPSYTNVAILDNLYLDTTEGYLFLACFKITSEPAVLRQVAIEMYADIKKGTGPNLDALKLEIYNFTNLVWETLGYEEVIAYSTTPTMKKITGDLLLNFSEYVSLGFMYIKLSTESTNSIVSLDYAELCLTSSQDGIDAGLHGCITKVDYGDIVHGICYTNLNILITTSPENFIADAGTQELGPGNTHDGGSGYNADYTRISTLNNNYIHVVSSTPRFLFNFVCSVDEAKRTKQIDFEGWVSVGRAGATPLFVEHNVQIWNFSTTSWETIITRQIKTVLSGGIPYALIRAELKTLSPVEYINNGNFYFMTYCDTGDELDYFYVRSLLHCGWADPKLQYMTFGANNTLGMSTPGLLYSEGAQLGVPVFGEGILTNIKIITDANTSNTINIFVNTILKYTVQMDTESFKDVAIDNLYLQDGDIITVDTQGVLINQIFVKIQIMYELNSLAYYM